MPGASLRAVRFSISAIHSGSASGRLGVGGGTPAQRGELSVLETVLSASSVQDLRRQLPGLTGGEGVIESEFAGYQPVTGEPPTRRRR